MNFHLSVNPDQCRVFSTTFFSPLSFFVPIFLLTLFLIYPSIFWIFKGVTVFIWKCFSIILTFSQKHSFVLFGGSSFFHPSFCLIFLFSWSSSSWTQFSLPSLSWVCEQQFPFFLCHFWNYPFYMHAIPLYVLLLFIHLFICCLFFLFWFSLFYPICFPFLSCFLCLWPLLRTSIWNFCIFWLFTFWLSTFSNFFVFACLSFLSVFFFFNFFYYSSLFLNMILFCSLSWTYVSSLFLHFYCPFWFFLGVKILFALIILFLPFLFSHFTYFNFFNKNMIFWILSVFTVSFFLWKRKSVSHLFLFLIFSKGEIFLCVFSFFLFFSSSQKNCFIIEKLCLLSL